MLVLWFSWFRCYLKEMPLIPCSSPTKKTNLTDIRLVLTGELHGEDWLGQPAGLLLLRGAESVAEGMDGFSSKDLKIVLCTAILH